MNKNASSAKLAVWEFFFQALLLVVVFIFYSHDRRNPAVEAYEVAFFLNYAVAAFIINYLLLPRFLYQKKYARFGIFVLVVITVAIFVEEGILEKIYFPDTRGTRFSNMFFNLLSVLPIITILAGFKFAWDALTKQRQVEQLQSAVKESELQFLKTQINPHFLFNNLNNLYAHAIENSDKTPQLILELSGVLRYMLYEASAQFVPLTKEVEHLQNFVNLSQLQIEGRGEVHFEEENIRAAYEIAPLILPVFVENAFKHSASSLSENIRIDISLKLDERGILHFECTNNFLTQSNIGDLSKGIGLENVKKRLELLYPNSHTLRIDEDGKTYAVKLSLQLQKSNGR